MNILNNITYDLPVDYRNIKIYPITMKDYLSFSAYSGCLLIDKNSIPDVKIIEMTELEYIYYSSNKNMEEKPYLLYFDRLLSLCLKDDESFNDIKKSFERYGYDKEKKPIFIIKEEIYKPEDFDNLKLIIAQQNEVELIDENISKEVRDSLEKARDFKKKLSGNKNISIEDYIISLSISTGWTFDYIYSMTIRKFLKSIRRMDNLIHYKIYLGASMSGMVEFKDKSFIKHWLSDLNDEDKYSDVSIDMQEMEDKISFESAKSTP
jgi:hypothetical protein